MIYAAWSVLVGLFRTARCRLLHRRHWRRLALRQREAFAFVDYRCERCGIEHYSEPRRTAF